jgi:hypothetical protein
MHTVALTVALSRAWGLRSGPSGKGGGWDPRTRPQGTLEARFTARQTYHVEKPFIRLIHREAASEGISITEVVNPAFRAYFERGR